LHQIAELQPSTTGERCHAILIEADEAYRAAIAASMRLAGCRVEQVATPDLAFPALEHKNFDLVVWGVSISDAGRRSEVISEVRLRTEAPLVLVDGSFDMGQLGLETGADQWVPKPFVPGALVGSVRAALRKSASSIMQVATRVEVRGMVLDGKTRRLTVGTQVVTFTRQEWELLSILVSHPNRFLGAREILRLGWRAGDHGSEQLRTYVRRLRLKLEPVNVPCRLLSQHGQGYCLDFD
jgi:DNA-binding response OmpR family regulator